MDFLLIIAVIAVIALVAVLFVQQNKTKSVLLSVEKDKQALEEKEKLLLKEARIKAIEELQDDREKLNEEERERRQELARQEQKLAKREDMLEDKIQEYTDKDLQAQRKIDELLEKEDYLAEIVQKQTTELERISGMSAEEAKTMLLDQLKHDLAQEQMQLVRENEAKIRETSLEKAKEILSTTMQRCMIEQVVETTVSVVALPNDEMKGRIIGREGRNIRALETLTGVDLIIDDTPEAVVLSSFDPVRREIAKLALEKLIVDGRIHPVRIEEMVEKAQDEIDKKIWAEGENAALEMGVMGLNKELIKTLGRLYYRTSYGQNVLKHSLEVGHIAGMLAAEIGANEKIAKRAALLHDIGKIGIKDSVLQKEGKLTDEEYKHIQEHVRITHDILEKIHTSDDFKQITEIACSHHEKFDGSGYYRHLSGEDIPYGGRILAVADVFDAITSKRHYRDKMPIQNVIDILISGKNKHFDGSLVDTFLHIPVDKIILVFLTENHHSFKEEDREILSHYNLFDIHNFIINENSSDEQKHIAELFNFYYSGNVE